MKELIVLFILFVSVLPAKAEDMPATESQTTDTLATPKKSLKSKFYYGYNFDIYFHNDTKDRQHSNGWSFTLTPEFGYKIKDRTQVGLRLGGSYYSQRESFTVKNESGSNEESEIVIRGGSWELAPYGRYCLKKFFKDRLGIWLELHGYVSMQFPSIVQGNPAGTDYEGLRYSVTYGAQLSPLITFKFNEKSTLNFFFSILSLGYSGTARMYKDAAGVRSTEYSNDVILFSG